MFDVPFCSDCITSFALPETELLLAGSKVAPLELPLLKFVEVEPLPALTGVMPVDVPAAVLLLNGLVVGGVFVDEVLPNVEPKAVVPPVPLEAAVLV